MNAVDGISLWGRFFLAGWGLPFTLYVLAQALAVVRFKGRARMWAAAPIPLMAWVLYATLDAFAQQSNLWPVLMILTSPVALAYLVLLAIAVSLRRRAKASSGSPGAI